MKILFQLRHQANLSNDFIFPSYRQDLKLGIKQDFAPPLLIINVSDEALTRGYNSQFRETPVQTH